RIKVVSFGGVCSSLEERLIENNDLNSVNMERVSVGGSVISLMGASAALGSGRASSEGIILAANLRNASVKGGASVPTGRLVVNGRKGSSLGRKSRFRNIFPASYFWGNQSRVAFVGESMWLSLS